MQIHNEFNLKCNQCDKVFNRRIPLIKHLKFHLNPRMKPYKCVSCGYTNDRKENVIGHVTKVHKKEWVQEDILVDREEEARMLQILYEQADKIQGYKDGHRRPQGRKGPRGYPLGPQGSHGQGAPDTL